jgi:putative transferase (TIGR04331 family)
MRKIIVGSEIPEDFDDNKYILYGYLKGDYNSFLSKIYLFDKINEINHEDLLNYNNLTFQYILSNSNKVKEYLNNLMGTDFSISFWEVIFNPWWVYMVQYYHFQKKSIQKFVKQYENEKLEFEALDINAFNFRFKDTNDFITNGLSNPDYNHWVISRIIEKLAPDNLSISYVSKKIIQSPDNTKPTLKKKLGLAYHNLQNLLFPNILGLYNLNFLTKIRLFYIFKNLNSSKKSTKTEILLSDSQTNLFFDDIFFKIWKLSIPNSFYNAKINKFKVRGSVLFDSSEFSNDYLKIRMANYRNIGSSIFSLQHGGHNYGTGNISSFLIFDYLFADTFIKWGEYNNKQIFNKSIFLPYKTLKRKLFFSNKILKGKIIWIGTHNINFFFRYDSNLQMSHIQEYRSIKINFFTKMVKDYKLNSIFVFRPYFYFKGAVNDSEYFKKELPDLNIYEEKFDFDTYSHAKLIIMDHPGTTLNYAFSKNIPTICIWKAGFYKFTDEANEIFQEMKKNNLLFDDEYLLYEFIVSKKDINIWWNSESVQKIISKYRLTYSTQKSNWIKEWSRFLR